MYYPNDVYVISLNWITIENYYKKNWITIENYHFVLLPQTYNIFYSFLIVSKLFSLCFDIFKTSANFTFFVVYIII